MCSEVTDVMVTDNPDISGFTLVVTNEDLARFEGAPPVYPHIYVV